MVESNHISRSAEWPMERKACPVKHTARWSALLWLVATCLVLGLSSPTQAHEPWYADLGGHWSRPYVWVMWEEGVTDGWVFLDGAYTLFWPNRQMTRAEYAVLLAKAFRLNPVSWPVPYLDVPTGLTINATKPAFGHISAAYHRGILPAGEQFFGPENHLTREVAVSQLILGLGLEPYASALSPAEVALALYMFPDHHAVSPHARPAMAAAARLGIIQGYEDGTLRPQQLMTRAEAVTIIYRSCVLLLRVVPPAFSPDGDGIDDLVEIYLDVLKNRNVTTWNLAITDSRGAVLRTFNPIPATPGPPPASVLWDGTQASGRLLPSGLYFARGWVTDRNGMVHWSVMQPVYIVDYRVWGHVLPAVAQPGSNLALYVYTSTPAWQVRWNNGELEGELARQPTGGGLEWFAPYPVPPAWPDGTYTIKVQADFPSGASRGALLAFQVAGDLGLMGWLYPGTCYPGQRLVIEAVAWPIVNRVFARFSDGELLELVAGPELWSGSRLLPPGLDPGLQLVEITAVAPGRERSIALTFWLLADAREDYAFVLTD